MPEETPADRAARAVADSIAEARDRTAADASDPDIPVAATVVLLRDGAEGPEVLLLERPERGSFAGAWVFPGGKIEDADRVEAEEGSARRAAVRETREETGLEVDPGALVTLSRWDPPPGIALRIRTWFFVAEAPPGDLHLQPDEAVAAEWAQPAELLARHGRGELTLYPPTWVTLHGLTAHPDAASALSSARLAGSEHFETVARRGAEGPILLWQDDAEYGPDAAAAASRHRLEIGALPWRYTREG
ncbi:NUDIX domain-containing protein [Microbacterium insulae]|uniref:NUDIX domain-containing protein n=1 Tax=Microbacterium insulae TaxID=483014 RepID=A0ABW3ADI5_9MICO